MTQQLPGTRARGSIPAQNPADAERSAFIADLTAKGGNLWVGSTKVEGGKKVTPTRVYFERTDAEYAAEIKVMRAAAGGTLSVWPPQKVGYVDVNTREYVSQRPSVSNADFRASLAPADAAADSWLTK